METLEPDTQSIRSFFHRFEKEERRLQGYKIERDRTALSRFLRNFGSYERLAFQFRAQSATYFNVFEVIRLGRYEEKLHTPFLAHLFDPAGTHSQGRLFFDAFLSRVLGMGDGLNGISHIEVLPEHHTPFGRIDILVKYRADGRLKAIIIENKIYASDQKEQLERYENYLVKTLQMKPEDYRLIYLSPWGGKPSEFSISKENYERLKNAGNIHEISYREQVANFLSTSLLTIKAPVVAETVKQYLQIIQRL